MPDSKISLRGVISFLRKRDFYFTLARYVLGAVMISFGTMKIMGMQFNTIAGPTSSYRQPLEYLTGIQLTWAFLGYATWLQVMLGIFEVVPAILLLFRRTAFLGAVFLLPMSVSVCLINFGLHLWTNTQLLSLSLLALNLLLISMEWEKLKQIINIALAPQRKYGLVVAEIVVAFLVAAVPITKKMGADYGRSTQNVLSGDCYHHRPNEYTLIAERINDSTLPHHELQCFFGAWEEYSEINDRGNNWDGYKRYAVDEGKATVRISSYANKRSTVRGDGYYYLSGEFRCELPGDTALVLQQTMDEFTIHTWVFRKRVMRINKEY